MCMRACVCGHGTVLQLYHYYSKLNLFQTSCDLECSCQVFVLTLIKEILGMFGAIPYKIRRHSLLPVPFPMAEELGLLFSL